MAESLAPTTPGASASAVSPEELHRRKVEWWNEGGREIPLPSNVSWAETIRARGQGPFASSVLRKPTRTLSGIAVVAVMTSPAACPHGRCTYCPGGPANGSPQSYTGEEPSALRGAQFHFDARAITEHRLGVLERIGHPTSKVEVIVMGGTFPSRPLEYQTRTFQGVFEGLNGGASPSLAEAQRQNERAAHRCVGLTVETRPDWCDGRILPYLLDAGVTRIEIGVECLDETVLLATGRAHGVGQVRVATREARDRGLKVTYHVMLGLPGMDPAKDLRDFRELFANPVYRPDMLKIYPTLVLPGTSLYRDWESGRYAPYDIATAAALLADEKEGLPPWVRIQRIQRDIPARLIAAGVRAGNLREMALAELARRGKRCRCLRCREPGRRGPAGATRLREVEHRYSASAGEEVFLSFEDPDTDTVAGFLRLRFPSALTVGGLRDPVVRELKVLGREVPVGELSSPRESYQHQGLGRRLVHRAERAARDAGFRRLYVLSAVGTREYYRRLGFVASGPHMAKELYSPCNR